MAQYRRSTSSVQDSAVNLHLIEKGHSFKDSNVLEREDRWFEKGVKEALYVHLEKLSLNTGVHHYRYQEIKPNQILFVKPEITIY